MLFHLLLVNPSCHRIYKYNHIQPSITTVTTQLTFINANNQNIFLHKLAGKKLFHHHKNLIILTNIQI